MNNSAELVDILTVAFRDLITALRSFGESFAEAATGIGRLHRVMLLGIRRDYTDAGKPHGNGYAAMMRWWRGQHPELLQR